MKVKNAAIDLSNLNPIMAQALAPFVQSAQPAAKLSSWKYKDLISSAKQFEYYASVTTGDVSARWTAYAAEKRAEADAMPDDFVDPEFRMPEWGTYGT